MISVDDYLFFVDEALDGMIEIDSPEGGPTTITARLPCGS